jgi:hypothetical protein
MQILGVWSGLLLRLLAIPVLLVREIGRMRGRVGFFRVASAATILCECGAQVALVGLWRCSCGFTYRGHLLTVCPVCSTIPCVARCYRCGVTTRLPDPV